MTPFQSHGTVASGSSPEISPALGVSPPQYPLPAVPPEPASSDDSLVQATVQRAHTRTNEDFMTPRLRGTAPSPPQVSFLTADLSNIAPARRAHLSRALRAPTSRATLHGRRPEACGRWRLPDSPPFPWTSSGA